MCVAGFISRVINLCVDVNKKKKTSVQNTWFSWAIGKQIEIQTEQIQTL